MRITNRIVATLLALVVLAVAVVTVVEIVLAALGQSPWIVQHSAISQDLHQRTWQDGLVRVVATAGIVLGLFLLWLGIQRSAPSDVPLDSDVDGVTVSATRTSLERYVAGIAAAEPGVDGSSATAKRGRVSVRASTTLQDPGDLEGRVQRAVTGRLAALRLAEPFKTSVSIRSGQSS